MLFDDGSDFLVLELGSGVQDQDEASLVPGKEFGFQVCGHSFPVTLA